MTARQPGLTCAFFCTMQALIRGMSGISLEHRRIASPEHICCASDEKTRLGDVWSAMAAVAKAKRAVMVLQRVMKNASPSSVGLSHLVLGRRTRLDLPHVSAFTPGPLIPHVVARFHDVRIEKCCAARVKYAPLSKRCNGRRE
jgi:hypothetical protein